MTLETVRGICRALPRVTEDIKWQHDLCFCVAGKMFAVVDLEPPHSIAFKCTPDTFGELVERPGIIPAPYMARNMWVQGTGARRSPRPAGDGSADQDLLRTGRRQTPQASPASEEVGPAAFLHRLRFRNKERQLWPKLFCNSRDLSQPRRHALRSPRLRLGDGGQHVARMD